MKDGYYEFKTLEASEWGVSVEALQRLGDEGWEGVSAARRDDDKYEILFRRPAGGASDAGDWEYHVFHENTYHPVPEPDWTNHLAGCGWVIFGVIYYYLGCYRLAKRPGSLRGADDGDVEARLKDLEYSVPTHGDHEEMLREILKVKWDESVRHGQNIGTYEAVRHWLAHTVVPRLLQQAGVTMPTDRSPEALLDELYNLRSAIKSKWPPYRKPGLEETVEYWCQSQT